MHMMELMGISLQGIIKKQTLWQTIHCYRSEVFEDVRSVTRAQGHLPMQNESDFHHLKVVLHLHFRKFSAFVSVPLYYYNANS